MAVKKLVRGADILFKSTVFNEGDNNIAVDIVGTNFLVAHALNAGFEEPSKRTVMVSKHSLN